MPTTAGNQTWCGIAGAGTDSPGGQKWGPGLWTGWGKPREQREAGLVVPSQNSTEWKNIEEWIAKVLQGQTHFANPCRGGLECLNLKTMFKAMCLIDSQLPLIKGFSV